jgi:hypothetical protein
MREPMDMRGRTDKLILHLRGVVDVSGPKLEDAMQVPPNFEFDKIRVA